MQILIYLLFSRTDLDSIVYPNSAANYSLGLVVGLNVGNKALRLCPGQFCFQLCKPRRLSLPLPFAFCKAFLKTFGKSFRTTFNATFNATFGKSLRTTFTAFFTDNVMKFHVVAPGFRVAAVEIHLVLKFPGRGRICYVSGEVFHVLADRPVGKFPVSTKDTKNLVGEVA